jgi:hypothetical protein
MLPSSYTSISLFWNDMSLQSYASYMYTHYPSSFYLCSRLWSSALRLQLSIFLHTQNLSYQPSTKLQTSCIFLCQETFCFLNSLSLVTDLEFLWVS